MTTRAIQPAERNANIAGGLQRRGTRQGRRLDGSLQLFASDIDDREGGGDAIKSERASTTLLETEKKFASKFRRCVAALARRPGETRGGWSPAKPPCLVPLSSYPRPGISRSRFKARLCWRYSAGCRWNAIESLPPTGSSRIPRYHG